MTSHAAQARAVVHVVFLAFLAVRHRTRVVAGLRPRCQSNTTTTRTHTHAAHQRVVEGVLAAQHQPAHSREHQPAPARRRSGTAAKPYRAPQLTALGSYAQRCACCFAGQARAGGCGRGVLCVLRWARVAHLWPETEMDSTRGRRKSHTCAAAQVPHASAQRAVCVATWEAPTRVSGRQSARAES